MKSKTLYTCEICHTDYADKEKAERCEKNHKRLDKAKFTGYYLSITQDATGAPNRIYVRFPDSDKVYEYRR